MKWNEMKIPIKKTTQQLDYQVFDIWFEDDDQPKKRSESGTCYSFSVRNNSIKFIGKKQVFLFVQNSICFLLFFTIQLYFYLFFMVRLFFFLFI